VTPVQEEKEPQETDRLFRRQHETSRSTYVEIDAVSFAFGELPVLDELTLGVPLHRRIGIVGASGSGKSTLLAIVAGLLEPDSGVVSIGGRSAPRERLACCVLMPQRDLLLPWRTALDNAALALENRGVSRSQARSRAQPLFERFGLGGFERRRPAGLSGGMRQRVAFVRTLLAEKEVLLFDEPFGALDALTRADLQEWLAGALEQEPRTVLLVTHDVEEALYLCDHVVALSHRPARVAVEFKVDFARQRPRREIVTDPEFVALRDRALAALE